MFIYSRNLFISIEGKTIQIENKMKVFIKSFSWNVVTLLSSSPLKRKQCSTLRAEQLLNSYSIAH
jgi:hypothetical protein